MITRRMSLRTPLRIAVLLSAALVTGCAGSRELMLIGLDEKTSWDDAGKVVNGLAGKDQVLVVDIGSDPLAPRIVARLPLMNTIFGPPTNLQITPDGKLALVANSMDWVADGAGWKPSPDTKLYVIDLTTEPPKLIDTVQVGKQPSGLSINRAGDLCLIANRADNSISVLKIAGTSVKLIDTIPMGEQVAAVAITPDGRRALAAKFPGNKIAVLEINGEKVSYNKQDLPAGLWPYNVDITPDGRLGLTADNGNAGSGDGNIDTLSVIDIEASPPRVVDKILVNESPEGLTISPTGKFAAAALVRGGISDKKAFFYTRNGAIALLRIDGKKVTHIQDVDVGAVPEGIVWSDDGQYLYVGNFFDSDVWILKLDAGRLVDTGKRLALPGHPASMRGRAR